MKKTLNQLRKFELSRDEQKQIQGKKEYCRSVAYDGQVKTFCSDSATLTDSWADVWIGFGGADFPQHLT